MQQMVKNKNKNTQETIRIAPIPIIYIKKLTDKKEIQFLVLWKSQFVLLQYISNWKSLYRLFPHRTLPSVFFADWNIQVMHYYVIHFRITTINPAGYIILFHFILILYKFWTRENRGETYGQLTRITCAQSIQLIPYLPWVNIVLPFYDSWRFPIFHGQYMICYVITLNYIPYIIMDFPNIF